MPAAYIVTEGYADAEILRRCLPEELTRDVYIAVGEERSSAMSLAGSILVVKAHPVALVVDAESEDEAAIQEGRDFAKAFLRQRSGGVPFEVFVAVPVFEAVLFESKSAESMIGRLLGKPIPDGEFEKARCRPTKWKKWLVDAKIGYPTEIARLLDRLTKDDWAALRQHPLIQRISDFLTRVTADDGSSRGPYRRTVQI
jgi:hypothetical protein